MATSKSAAKKAAPPAPVATVEATIGEGTKVKFTGYGPEVADEERFLVEGEVYTVAGISEPDTESDYAGGDPYVTIENPDFNPKKKESDANPKTLSIVLVEGEFEVVADEEPEAAPAAKKTVGKAKATEKAAPAKSAGKPAAKKAAAPVEEEAEGEDDGLPDLENEDPEVMALVDSGENLIEVAQNLEADAAKSEYRLGGLLYHIKKDGSFKELDNGAYADKKGFDLFVGSYFNIGYRKAMYLIDIYVAFTQAQIENPAEKVAAMGWAKASKIARPMMVEGSKPADLVELAENSTLEDLSTAIKEQVTVGRTSTAGTKVTRTTLKFRLLEQDGTTVASVLEAVRKAQGFKDIGEALVYIVNDWATTNAPAALPSKAPSQKVPTKKGAPAKKAAAKA